MAPLPFSVASECKENSTNANFVECWCGFNMTLATVQPSLSCDLPCPGNSAEICGASLMLSIYNSSTIIPPPPAPQPLPTVGDSWYYWGCYAEPQNGRALSDNIFYDYVGMTNLECSQQCAGFLYFGTEYGGECNTPTPPTCNLADKILQATVEMTCL
jgi:WSC domain